MADDPRDDNRNGNVVSFRSRGGAPPGLPPIPGAPPPAPPDPPAEPPPPASGPENGDSGTAVPSRRRRRSAADSLADLALALPLVPGSTPSTGTVALRSEGTTPARRDGDDAEADGPGVAALGLAATLAIALAALRGTTTVLADWRQRRLERAEELAPLREARLKHRLAGEEAAAKHAAAMQGIGDKAAQKRGKTIPSSQDYGRKTLGGGRGSLTGSGKGTGPGGRGAGGTGPGRNGKSGSGSGGTAPGGKKTSPKTSTGSGSVGTKGGSKPLGSGKNGSSGKSGSSGSGIKSPSGGKSPSSKSSSPALERARGRQDRAAARQGARTQRRADRQAARLENRAKDRDAARDRTGRAKDARQDTKDRVRNARADAKQARQEQMRQDRFEAKQKERKARAKARRKKKETAAAADADRTTLRQAVAGQAVAAARRRLEARRKDLAPPVLTRAKKPSAPGATGQGAAPAGPKVDLTKKPKPGSAPKVDLTKKPKPAGGSTPGTGPKVDLTKKPKPGGTKGSGPGRKKARVKPKPKKKTGGSSSGTGPADRRKASRKERARRAGERARAKAGADSSAGTGWEFYTPPREERRSAYDSMRDTDPQQQEVWTAEQVFPPGYHAPAREPLTIGVRGLPAGAGSTITIIKEAPVGNLPAVPVTAVATAMDNGMNPEHATEVTLDDVVDFLDGVVSDAFAAHDECLVLAAQAKELMYALDEVAARLAAKHNIIGRLSSWAMSKLAESMEVLSRKAEEMSVKSLHAAETCETAKTEMDDAYRPLTQATADAGLRTPSARVHNEN